MMMMMINRLTTSGLRRVMNNYMWFLVWYDWLSTSGLRRVMTDYMRFLVWYDWLTTSGLRRVMTDYMRFLVCYDWLTTCRLLRAHFASLGFQHSSLRGGRMPETKALSVLCAACNGWPSTCDYRSKLTYIKIPTYLQISCFLRPYVGAFYHITVRYNITSVL